MGFILFKRIKMENAVRAGDAARVESLLFAGVSADLADVSGGRFVLMAIKLKQPDVLGVFLDHKTSLDSHYGGTLLHDAVRAGSLDCARLLLDRYPELVNIQDRGGETPLHEAARLGHADIAELLLARGADQNIRNEGQRAPLYYAQKEDRIEICALLRAPVVNKEKAEGWIKLSDDQIAHVSVEKGLGYRITDIFNFKAAERTRLCQNIDTFAETGVTMAFDDMANQELIESAREALTALGGHPPRHSGPRRIFLHKPKDDAP